MNLPRTWRKWILGWVFLALIGIQIIESTHHHESEAAEDACVVCQFVAHLPLNIPQPAIATMGLVLVLLYILSRQQLAPRVADSQLAFYSPRAPPYPAP